MYISEILARKGNEVKSVAPGAAMETAAAVMRLERVGAVVVLAKDGALAGLLSEKDVVRALVDRGPRMLGLPVSDFMEDKPLTCAPDETVARLAQRMTVYRARHVPVVEDGHVRGIVSIGDVVKDRFEEMALERDTLRDLARSSTLAG